VTFLGLVRYLHALIEDAQIL